MIIKVLEEKPVPRSTVKCLGCGSLLEYGNGDLFKDYPTDGSNYSYLYGAGHNYYFNCPVCGVKVSASWINRKEESV